MAAKLLERPHLLLLNFMRKMYLVIRSPPFPSFPDEGLNALELTKFVSRLERSISR